MQDQETAVKAGEERGASKKELRMRRGRTGAEAIGQPSSKGKIMHKEKKKS